MSSVLFHSSVKETRVKNAGIALMIAGKMNCVYSSRSFAKTIFPADVCRTLVTVAVTDFPT